jgi:hypothetical protein
MASAHAARVPACGSGSGAPVRASSTAGRTTSRHGSRPQRRWTSPQPAGTPGTHTLGAPMEYSSGTPPKVTLMAVIGQGMASPSRPGTATKKSRQVTVRERAS